MSASWARMLCPSKQGAGAGLPLAVALAVGALDIGQRACALDHVLEVDEHLEHEVVVWLVTVPELGRHRRVEAGRLRQMLMSATRMRMP